MNYYGERCLAQQPQPPHIGNLKEPPGSSTGGQPSSKPPKKGGFVKTVMGVSLVGVGGAIAYAWYDQEFRKKLKGNIPYSEGVIDAIFTYLPDSPAVPAPYISNTSDSKFPQLGKDSKIQDQQLLPRLKESPEKIGVSQPPLPTPPVVPPKPTKEKPKDKLDQKQKLEEEAKAQEAAKKKQEEEAEAEARRKQEEEEARFRAAAKRKQEEDERDALERKLREKEEARRRQAEKESNIAAENASLEVNLENIIEACDATIRKALEAEDVLIEATKQHTDLLKIAMYENSSVKDEETQWQSVAKAFDKREEAMKMGEEVIKAAKENLDKLRQAIDSGRESVNTKQNKALAAANEKLTQLTTAFSQKVNEVSKVESESRVISKYKDLVDKARTQFKKEMESITPDVKIGKGPKLSEDELNALLAHAHRRVEQLQKQTAELLAMEGQRIQMALAEQRDEDELITQARVQQERQKLLDEFAVMKDKWEADAQVQFEIELRRNLARQTAAHSEHLQEIIRQQEERLLRTFEQELHMRILEDRKRFEGELSGRINGIEAAIAARAESEMQAKEAQALWLACVSLNGALRLGNEEGKTWEEQLKPLEKEVDKVFFAAKNNPFVCLILETIPEKALKRGVFTEENLKDRFKKVSSVAKKVALIDETGGKLSKYFLSYIQSKFIVSRVYAKEHGSSVDLDNMDTFQICSHAEYWLERNDIEQALKFMNQLHGESRRVAADWIEEARLLLETRQATYSVMAFASSTGLGTLF